MKNKIIQLGFFLVILSSCSNEVKEPVRADVQNLSAQAQSLRVSPLVSSIENSSITACDRLSDLNKNISSSEKNRSSEIFSYFDQLKHDRSGWQGALSIAESPFVQVVLGEKFKVDDVEEFYKKAKAEYEAGKLSGVKWLVVKFMHSIGSLKSIQYSATNDKLEEKFPGLFGEMGSVESSLHWSLVKRAVNEAEIGSTKTAKILTAKIPLFPGDRSWEAFAESAQKSLAAAAKGMESTDAKEKLCSLVLFHQSFAQLLRLKGYSAPQILERDRSAIVSHLEKLSSTNPEFQKNEKYGSFMSLRSAETVVLDNEDISQYDPTKGILSITSKINDGLESKEPANLIGSLSLMEALISNFEATSPASPWIKNYFLGDIQGEGKAILPAEANTLALGLLTIHFKNLAALHIRKITADGRIAGEKDPVAGVLFVSNFPQKNIAKVKLAELVRFALVISYFENALNNFIKIGAEEVLKKNEGYKIATLVSLFGKNMFTKEQLTQLDPKADVSILDRMSLIDNLRALKFPVAVLMSRLASSEKGCFSELNWNITNGNNELSEACSENLKAQAAVAFTVMGRDTGSQLLLKKGRQQ